VRTNFSFLQARVLASILLLAGFNSVSAQELIFDNSLEQVAIITSFSTSANSIAAGESTTLSWTTDSATSCTPSGGAGEWSSLGLGVPDGNAQIEIFFAGSYTFTLTCQGVVGAPVVEELDVTVSANAVITSFSASPDSILEGGGTTVIWTTANATSCTTSGGTAGWLALNPNVPDGNAQIVISTTGSYTFTLTCEGTVGDPVIANATVTVSLPVAITSFNAAPTSITEGSSTTLSWTTENATSCTPSGGTGGWDAESVILPDGDSQISIPVAGEYTFILICEGAAGSQAVADVTVTASPAVVITDFSASPDLLLQGESTTLSWTTEHAVSCAPSGGTDGWDLLAIAVPDGSAPLVLSTEGVHTFSLICEGAAGDQVTADITVTVEGNGCPTPPLTGTVKPWLDFWLEDFPKPVFDHRFAFIPRKGYFALEFNTGNVIDDAKMTTIETTFEDGVRLGSFAECPGDFDVAPECKYSWGISGGLRWATNGRAGACQLKPNTTYYFNVTFTDGVSGSTTTCDASNCVTNLEHLNP
jgi:hypothetical protein